MLPNVASTFPVAALSYSHTSYHWIPVILTRDQHLPYHFTFSGIYGKQWSHLSVCCFFPKGRAWYLFFLNFMRFPLAHSSSLLKSLWMASFLLHSCCTPHTLVPPMNLMTVQCHLLQITGEDVKQNMPQYRPLQFSSWYQPPGRTWPITHNRFLPV